MRRFQWLALFTSFAAPIAGASSVLIVDPSVSVPPPGTFQTVQAAIDAAADGDAIRVKASLYGTATISGKSLTLVGEPSQSGTENRPVITAIDIGNLSASQHVLMRGFLNQEGGIPFSPSSFNVHDNAGIVVLEDVIARSFSLGFSSDDPIVRVRNSASVSLIRCQVTGKMVSHVQGAQAYPLGTGLAITNSSVHVHAGSVHGGGGVSAQIGGFNAIALDGGPGLLLVSGTLRLLGAEVRGGAGGDGVFDSTTATCKANGSGGTAVVSAGHWTRFASTIEGGAAGANGSGCPFIGVPGQAIQMVGGSLTSLPGVARSVQIEAPVVLGTTSTLTWSGFAGDSFLYLFNLAPATLWAPTLQGTTLMQLPAIAVPLGTLGATGTVSVPVAIASDGLPVGIDAVELYAQALVIGSDGDGVLSAPSATVIVR